MNIVVECSCQTSYEFEIEPIDGKMPGPAACPTCGADGTEYANQVIHQTLEQEQAARPKITLKRPAQEEAPVEPSAPADQDGPGLPKFCFFHEDQPMEGFCLSCKKPICLKCMKQSGYFCSAGCRGRAEAQGMDIPEYAGQERLVRLRENERITRITMVSLTAVVVLFVVYEWYQIWGKKPSVTFTMPLKGDYQHHATFISGRELLLTGPDKVSVYDFKAKREIWANSLAAYRSAKPPVVPVMTETAEETMKPEQLQKLAEQMAAHEDYYNQNVSARAVGDSVWVTMGRNVIGFDRVTGTEKAKTRVEGNIQQTGHSSDALLVVSSKSYYDQIFTHVELPSGKQQIERRSNQPPARVIHSDSTIEQPPHADFKPNDYVIAGSTIAALNVKLLEERIATVETMKPAKPNAISQDLKATQLREVADEVFNEMKRAQGGGTAHVDQSRYSITIQRLFGQSTAPWTGEIVGAPHFFALETVDLLVAGQMMYVFDRSNRKLWESKLSYPIAPQFESGDSWGSHGEREAAKPPGIERGNTLYFFDRGVLTAFDTKSGTVRWRLPSVGISQIQFDDKNMLYVTTTSAGPESIQYSEQISFGDQPEPVIEKIDPADGKILWRLQKFGDECHLAGKHVLITKARGGNLLMSTPSSSFFLARLNPRNGKRLWEFNTLMQPSAVDFHDNKILFQYEDRLEIMKFFAL